MGLSYKQFSRIRKVKEPPELVFKVCLVYLWVFLCHTIRGEAQVVVFVHGVIMKQNKGNSSDNEQVWCWNSNPRSVNKHHSLSPMEKLAVVNVETEQEDLWHLEPWPWRLQASPLVECQLLSERDKDKEPFPLLCLQAHRHTDMSEWICTGQEVPDSWSHRTCPQFKNSCPEKPL